MQKYKDIFIPPNILRKFCDKGKENDTSLTHARSRVTPSPSLSSFFSSFLIKGYGGNLLFFLLFFSSFLIKGYGGNLLFFLFFLLSVFAPFGNVGQAFAELSIVNYQLSIKTTPLFCHSYADVLPKQRRCSGLHAPVSCSPAPLKTLFLFARVLYIIMCMKFFLHVPLKKLPEYLRVLKSRRTFAPAKQRTSVGVRLFSRLNCGVGSLT